MRRMGTLLPLLLALCACAAPTPERTPAPTPEAETAALPEQTPSPTPEPTQDPYGWLADPAEIETRVTVEGFYHRPFEELSQELRDTLTWEGTAESEQGYSFRLRTYTAPGLEIVTTEAPPEVLDRYREETLDSWRESGESWEDWGGWTHCPSPEAFEAEVEGEKGREWLYSATFRDESYATAQGLKVGLTVREAQALGYPLAERQSFGTAWGNNLQVTLEGDRVTGLHVWWAMGRYVGRYWDI